jgi:hypothetical protein
MCTLNRIEIDNPDMWEVNDFKNVEIQRRTSMNTSIESISPLDMRKFTMSKRLIINEIVEIIEYAPYIYSNIRAIDGITNKEILESLSPA